MNNGTKAGAQLKYKRTEQKDVVCPFGVFAQLEITTVIIMARLLTYAACALAFGVRLADSRARPGRRRRQVRTLCTLCLLFMYRKGTQGIRRISSYGRGLRS